MVDSKLFEAVQSTDWHVKAVVAAVTIIVSLLASDWIGRLRLSWRLRKYPLVNTGWGPKAQMEFYMTGDKLLHKGLEMVRATRPAAFWYSCIQLLTIRDCSTKIGHFGSMTSRNPARS